MNTTQLRPLNLVPLCALALASSIIGGCTDAAAQTAPPAASPDVSLESAQASPAYSLQELRLKQTALTRLMDDLGAMRSSMRKRAAEAQGAAAWMRFHIGDGALDFANVKSDVIEHEGNRVRSLRSEVASASDDLQRLREVAREQTSTRAAFAAELAEWKAGKRTHPTTYPDDAPQPLPGVDLDGTASERESIRQSHVRLADLRANLAFHQSAKTFWRGFSYDSLCSSVGGGYLDLARSSNSMAAQVKAIDDALEELRSQSEANKQAMRSLAAVAEVRKDPKASTAMAKQERETTRSQTSALAKALAAARREKTLAARDEGVVQAVHAFVACPMPTSLDMAQRYSSSVLSSIRSLSSASAYAPARYFAYLEQK